MRYLLDELTAYEEGFGDMLMPQQESERHESFMAENPTAAVTRKDFLEMQEAVVARVEKLLSSSPVHPDLGHLRANPSLESQAWIGKCMLNLLSLLIDAFFTALTPPETPTHRNQPAAPSVESSTTIISSPFIQSSTPPRLRFMSQPGRIPETNSMDDVIRYWTIGDASRGLYFPLAEWKLRFTRKDYSQSEAQKLSNLGFVYHEFQTHCEGCWDKFEIRFPGLRNRYKKLLAAVKAARIVRNECKKRNRRRK